MSEAPLVGPNLCSLTGQWNIEILMALGGPPRWCRHRSPSCSPPDGPVKMTAGEDGPLLTSHLDTSVVMPGLPTLPPAGAHSTSQLRVVAAEAWQASRSVLRLHRAGAGRAGQGGRARAIFVRAAGGRAPPRGGGRGASGGLGAFAVGKVWGVTQL